MVSDSGVHCVLVTFRRLDELAETLARLGEQTQILASLIVVDNDANDAVREIVESSSHVAARVEYRASDENLGPAGALALGTEHVLESADDGDWIVFFDDDDPPRTPDTVGQIVEFGDRVLRADSRLGAVGMVGARFDRRTGRLESAADEELSGPIEVSYIGGGQIPCYRVAVIKEVGLPNGSFFFGLDDLEYGLRFVEAGWNIYADGDAWADARFAAGRIGIDRSPSRVIQSVGWRFYYSTRNLVWILARRGEMAGIVHVIGRMLAKFVYNLPRHPRVAMSYLRLGARAVFDGWAGRMGRTVEPAHAD